MGAWLRASLLISSRTWTMADDSPIRRTLLPGAEAALLPGCGSLSADLIRVRNCSSATGFDR